MSWLANIHSFCPKGDYDEITICSKDGTVSETTSTAGLPNSHYASIAGAKMGSILKMYDDKFMLVNEEEGIRKFKGQKGFMAVDRLRGSTCENPYFVIVRSTTVAPGKATDGLGRFSKWCEDSCSLK